MSELVSIVVPIYNMETSIERCVKSLLNQDYDNYEIILVDDGSKDKTLSICQKLAAQDNRLKLIHTENRGAGPARNTGIEYSSGKYIYFPDADDYLEPEAISIMVNAMENGKCDLVVFGFKNVNQEGKTVFEQKYEERDGLGTDIRSNYSEHMGYKFKWGIQGAPWNKFFDLEIIKSNNIKFPPLRRHQDEGFIGRYMTYASRIHFIKDVLYTYYINDLKKEWQKYPVDYIDAVIGLNNVRKETIYTWNKDDIFTHDLLKNEYICNVIKALELSFSPKFNMSATERKNWMKANVLKSQIKDYSVPPITGKYQRIILKLIKNGNYIMLYSVLRLKITLENTKLYHHLRH